MKKFSLIGLMLMLVFGFASATFASGQGSGAGYAPGKTVHFEKGITTIVTTTKDVTYDKIVKVDKSTEYFVDKKSKSSSHEKVDVKVTKEKHKVHNWYRDVKTATTYKITKTTTWDEVTRVDTIKTTTTPVKIIKTTVRTVKHRGAPGSNGKVISDNTEVFTDKKYGKPEVDVKKHKTVYKKNEHTSYNKEVIDVTVTKGKWVKR